MPNRSRFEIMHHMKSVIAKYFQKCGKDLFSLNDISEILNTNKSLWNLASITKRNDFLKFLTNKKILEKVEIQLPRGKMVKYTSKSVSIHRIALSINANSYLSHYSAVFLHGLTENVPKTVYTNMEQAKKNQHSGNYNLEQENIDKAFLKPMRRTNNIAKIGDYNVYLLNGKYLGQLEVSTYGNEGEEVLATSMERTLIDIAIRPSYAGGVSEVLNAYKAAKGKVSVNRMNAILKKMAYIYPYHQVIGFYLENAGYEERLIKLFERQEIKYNFYLTYEMKDTEYSSRWKLFYPKGL